MTEFMIGQILYCVSYLCFGMAWTVLMMPNWLTKNPKIKFERTSTFNVLLWWLAIPTWLIITVYHNLQRAAAYQELVELDDRMLLDIGLSRSDVFRKRFPSNYEG